VPRSGSPSVCLAVRNAGSPASLLLWCLGGTDRGQTGTLGVEMVLERTTEFFRQTCHSSGDGGAGDWFSSLAVGRSSPRELLCP
jgi:hypothetical protein